MIRPADETDASSLAKLMTQLGYPTVGHEMRARLQLISNNKNFATFVAVESGIVCGMVGVSTFPSYEHNDLTGRILALVVSNRIRRRGVGRNLVAAVEDHFRRKGIVRMILTTRLEREEAHRFYEALGFTVTGFRFAKRLE